MILLDFNDYITACYDHLTSTQSDKKPYYSQVAKITVEKSKNKIKAILDEGLENNILSEEEYNVMNPEDKNPAKFYMNFKVHKPHNHIPPPRPIISGSGSITENIGKYVEHHITSVSSKHKSFLEDTPDLLRMIQKLNKGPKLPTNTLIVTWDVVSLFTNIKHTEGLRSLENKLEMRLTKKVPTDFIIKLMEVILKHNIFEFHDGLWKQEVGAAMGSPPVPSYANSLMADIDDIIETIASKYKNDENEGLRVLKRFLDDFFLLFVGTTKDLHKLFEEANQINPTIQFTMSHTSPEQENIEDQCDCEKKS